MFLTDFPCWSYSKVLIQRMAHYVQIEGGPVLDPMAGPGNGLAEIAGAHGPPARWTSTIRVWLLQSQP